MTNLTLLFYIKMKYSRNSQTSIKYFSFFEEMTNQMLAKSAIPLETTSNRRENLYILLAVSFVAIIVLIAVVFVLMRRRKIYGGFYLFSQPPDPDYLRDIDPRRALIEQTNGLPYDPVWEFPRKRIRLREYINFSNEIRSDCKTFDV